MAFPIREHLKYWVGKPNLEATLGIPFLDIVNQNTILNENMDMPSQGSVNSSLAPWAASTDLLCIDVEGAWWDMQVNQATRIAACNLYLELLEKIRIACPLAQVGYYSTLPIRDYFSALDGIGSPDYTTWQGKNNDFQPLANAVDVLFPSCYTNYARQADFLSFMAPQIAESKRLAPNKPCYPFIWPQYHDSNPHGMAYKFLPYRYWYKQMLCARKHADGVVIWGEGGHEWVEFETSGAWPATQDFAQRTDFRSNFVSA